MSGVTLGYLAKSAGQIIHAIGKNTFIIVRIMESFWFLTAIIIMIPTIKAGGSDDRFARERLKTQAFVIPAQAASDYLKLPERYVA